MTTITASDEAYVKILKQRHRMEEGAGKVVSISEALDALLEGLYVG